MSCSKNQMHCMSTVIQTGQHVRRPERVSVHMQSNMGHICCETSSAKQSVVALSSGEAEYYSLARGASAGLLVRGVYEEMRCI